MYLQLMLQTDPLSSADLVTLLSLEQLEPNVFRGTCHEGLSMRAFGGQVAAQALTAAGRTVPAGRSVHSLHGHFLRGSDPGCPIEYSVQRLREGESYVLCRVSACQDGEVIFTLSASFKRAEHTFDRQPLMPSVSGPHELPDLSRIWATVDPDDHDLAMLHRVLDLRYEAVPADQATSGQTEQRLWIRAIHKLPDDPLLHACALAYASDIVLAPAAALAVEPPRMLRGRPSSVFLASLDHAVWYHRPFRADEWMLFAQRSPSAADGRGLSFADVWSHGGALIASVVQETVLRPKRPPRT